MESRDWQNEQPNAPRIEIEATKYRDLISR